MNNISIYLILATIALVALIDYIPRLLMVAKKPIPVRKSAYNNLDYYLMPTVYGDISYLQNIEFLQMYADRVLICTSSYESDQFYADLDTICATHGFSYVKADLPFVNNAPVRNAYTIYKGVFSHLHQIKLDPEAVCILIDADTYAVDDLDDLVYTFINNRLDIASMRCEVANPLSVMQKLQAYEYKMAMDNRRVDPWLTSGACNMAKTSVYQHIFDSHSHYFAGGDIEIGKLAQVMSYNINHIDFTFYTAAPETFIQWYKQRLIWFAGGIRHHLINVASYGWHHFFLLFYATLLVYLLLPLRWLELINYPITFVALIVVSWIYTYIAAQNKGWNKTLLLLPLYSFVQSMIIVPASFITYCKLVRKQRSFGLLKYDLSHNTIVMRLVFGALNLASFTVVAYLAVIITDMRFEYWLQHGEIMKFLTRYF